MQAKEARISYVFDVKGVGKEGLEYACGDLLQGETRHKIS
jgi:hypothetical protein